MLLRRPFVDLGMTFVNDKTESNLALSQAVQANLSGLLKGSNDAAVSLGVNVHLLDALNQQKRNLYTPGIGKNKVIPKERPSTVDSRTARAFPALAVQVAESVIAPMSPVAPMQSPIASSRVDRVRPSSSSLGPAGYVAKPWSPMTGNALSPPRSMLGEVDGAFPLDDLLQAPEMALSLSHQTESLYREDLGRISPTALRLAQQQEHKQALTRHVSMTLDGSTRAVSLTTQPKGERAVKSVVEIALNEAQLVSELEDAFTRELRAAKEVVAARLDEEMRRESEREVRVRAQAAKENQCRNRIREMRESKAAETEARKAAKEEAREMMMQRRESSSSLKQGLKAEAAAVRKQKIISERENRQALLAASVKEHMENVDKLNLMRSEDLKELNDRKAAELERKMQEKIAFTAKLETDQLAARVSAMKSKADQHAAFEEKLAAEKEAEKMRRVAREVELGFQAEQRRRLIDMKRQGERQLGEVKMLKEKVVAKSRSKLAKERPVRLNKILAEQYNVRTQQGGGEQPLDVSPGPGEYHRERIPQPKGGLMASSRVPEPPNPNPGPGSYDLSSKMTGGTGVIPFLPRGKTDVDWIILRAKKLPGVGEYNIASRPKTVSTSFPRKGTSALDLVIKRGKSFPGPGDYDLDESTPPKGGIEMQLLSDR